MKVALVAILSLLSTSSAFAATAFYTTLGTYGPDGLRNPGLMVVVGEADLCVALRNELQSKVTNDWVKKAIAFVAIRTSSYPIAGTYNVIADDWTAAERPLVTASVYDVRQGEGGKLDLGNRVDRGRVDVSGDALQQEQLHLTLDLNFKAGGPDVEKRLVATYCPAYAALTQLWVDPN